MMAFRPDRLGADRIVPDASAPDKFGPEHYAPDRPAVDKIAAERFSGRRAAPEKLGDIGQAAANAVEGEIREFVRRDVTAVRRQRSEVETVGDPVADNLNALIRRVSGASMEEIDRVILELQSVRDMLRNEGDRVSREVAGYASLSHAAMTAMTVIADSLTQWKGEPPRQDAKAPPAANQHSRSAG